MPSDRSTFFSLIVPFSFDRLPWPLHGRAQRLDVLATCSRGARLGLVSAACALLLQACGGGGSEGITSTVRQEMSAKLPAGTTLIAGSGCDLRYSITSDSALVGMDPDLSNQWHLGSSGSNSELLGLDIQATAAWSLTKGSGVVVGVIDDSVEVSHSDLRANLVDGSVSFRDDNPSGYPIPCRRDEDDHGTAVAGIVLARDSNGVGGAGVAPRAGLIAYDALSTSFDTHIQEALTRKNQVIDIYQNSWGAPDTGAVSDSGKLFADAIDTGIRNGRNGKGSIFVFSGGNGGQFDNANLDGFANRKGIIAVCGVDRLGQRIQFQDVDGTAYGSEPGANLLVCAPGTNITTTALNGGMRNDFSGASAATPMVSGVAALMLSVNPALTWRDIPIILAETARKNGISNPSEEALKNGGWFRAPRSPDSLWAHPFYGFGVVDAQAAVERARTWASVGNSSTQRTCDSEASLVNQNIPDNSSSGLQVTLNLNCPSITRIEFVEVQVTTRHSYHGDLQIDLESPQGGVSELVQARTCDPSGTDPCGAFNGWTFGSVRHLNESANGLWTLKVSDRVGPRAGVLNTGSLLSWRVIVHGR
ncbi:MAG: S8 family peptidase [Burkholderiales bacterium]